jgi:hypothetical protein
VVVAQGVPEYLVSHGSAGDFGRFQAAPGLSCARGDRVVIAGRRGVELGVVLCPTTPRQARVLQNTSAGQILRLATADDEQAAERMRQRGQALFEDGRRLALELDESLEVLDVEVSLDGRQAVVQFLGTAACDVDAFAAALAGRHDLFILMQNLAVPVEETRGCGDPNCGRAGGGGGCTDCASGGCATGCGAGKADMKDYFAHLRAKMEQRNLTPLL